MSVPAPQTLAGTSYTFGSWSDGGAASHVITTPSTDNTYTATYTQATSGLTAEYFDNTVKSTDDVQRVAGIPVLSSISNVGKLETGSGMIHFKGVMW